MVAADVIVRKKKARNEHDDKYLPLKQFRKTFLKFFLFESVSNFTRFFLFTTSPLHLTTLITDSPKLCVQVFNFRKIMADDESEDVWVDSIDKYSETIEPEEPDSTPRWVEAKPGGCLYFS